MEKMLPQGPSLVFGRIKVNEGRGASRLERFCCCNLIIKTVLIVKFGVSSLITSKG